MRHLSTALWCFDIILSLQCTFLDYHVLKVQVDMSISENIHMGQIIA